MPLHGVHKGLLHLALAGGQWKVYLEAGALSDSPNPTACTGNAEQLKHF